MRHIRYFHVLLLALLISGALAACNWFTLAPPTDTAPAAPTPAPTGPVTRLGELLSSARSELAEEMATLSQVQMNVASEAAIAEAMVPPAAIAGAMVPPEAGGSANPNNKPLPLMYFEDYGVNPFVDADEDALSTFGLDGDTAAYEMARLYLRDAWLPPPESVRVEEYVNAFSGGYPASLGGLSLHLDAAPAPYGPEGYVLLRVGVAAPAFPDTRDPVSLIFIVDISGSMDYDNRLGLAKKVMLGLLDQTHPADRVGLVTYGNQARVAAPLEESEDAPQLRQLIEGLYPTGATNAEAGLVVAYKLADREMHRGRDVHLVLFSDGVGNVGATGPDQILEVVDQAAQRRATLTTVGVGIEGNFNDVMMERLANRGNGTYHYLQDHAAGAAFLDGPAQAVFHETVRDARIQVEFNPDTVRKYRLLGYENRAAADDTFRDDTQDFGELGFRKDVTALYELRPLHDAPVPTAWMATAHLRYRDSVTGEVVETASTLSWGDVGPPNSYFQRAAAVAEFAELLGRSFWAQCGTMAAVQAGLPGEGPAYDPQTQELHQLLAIATDLFTPFCTP